MLTEIHTHARSVARATVYALCPNTMHVDTPENTHAVNVHIQKQDRYIGLNH